MGQADLAWAEPAIGPKEIGQVELKADLSAKNRA